jgi:hypothetical protein
VVGDESRLVQVFVSLVLLVGEDIRGRRADAQVEILVRREHDHAVVELVSGSTAGQARSREQPGRELTDWQSALHLSLCRALIGRGGGSLHAEPAASGCLDFVRVLLPVGSDDVS